MFKRKVINITVAKQITQLSSADITLKDLRNLFAFNADDKQTVPPTDTLILQKDDDTVQDVGMRHLLNNYFKENPSKKTLETTAGRYITNLVLLCGSINIAKNMVFVNEPFTKGVILKTDSLVGRLLLEEIITSDEKIDFIDREQWLGFAPTKFIAPSFDEASLIPSDKMNKAKKEAAIKYKKELESVDVNGISRMEKELLDIATDEMRKHDSGGLDIYASGASGSLGNNYRNTQVMRGIIPRSDDLSKMTVSLSNLSEGIPKEELAEYADLMVLASMSRAVGTQNGGYEVKKANAAFQHIVAGEVGSDCGTKQTLTVKLDKDAASDWYMSFIVDKGKLVLLNTENTKLYLGKTVQIRTPSYCLDKHICNHCLGDLYRRLGITNIGLLLSRVGSNILNKFLKRFHDLTVKVVDIDVLSSITFEE